MAVSCISRRCFKQFTITFPYLVLKISYNIYTPFGCISISRGNNIKHNYISIVVLYFSIAAHVKVGPPKVLNPTYPVFFIFGNSNVLYGKSMIHSCILKFPLLFSPMQSILKFSPTTCNNGQEKI